MGRFRVDRLHGLWLGLSLLAGLLIAGASAALFHRSLERAEVMVEQAALAYLRLAFTALEDLDRYVSLAADRVFIDGSVSPEDLHELFRHRQQTSALVQDLAILDASGQLLVAAWPGPLPEVSGREYFTHHRDFPYSHLYVSEPQPSILYEGEWFISVSRALRDEQGGLLGVAVGMLSIEGLRDRLIDLLPHEELSISLLSSTGRLILRLPEDHGIATGADISSRAEPEGIPLPLTAAVTTTVRRGLDEKARLASFQPLPDYGLIAVASITLSEALATWRLNALATVLAWLVFAGLSLVLVSRLRRSIAMAQASESRFRRVVENASDLTILTQADGRLQYVSPNWKSQLGHEPSTVVGRACRDFIHPDDHDHVASILSSVVREGQTLNGVEYRVQHADSRWRWHSASISPLYHEDGRLDAIIGIVRDITDSRQARAQLTQMAHEDALTGLPNRARMSSLLAAAIDDVTRHGQMAAILFIDLDRFKPVNDEHGHETGDQLLTQVAQRIQSILRAPDIAARFGGDEFLALLHGIETPEQALRIAERIIRQLAQPFQINGHELQISCSIGVALYPLDGNNERELIQSADQAMYRAKQDGRSRTWHSSQDARAMG